MKQAPFDSSPGLPCFCGSGSSFGQCCGSMALDRVPPHGVHLLPAFLDSAVCERLIGQLEESQRTALGVHNLDHHASSGLDSRLSEGRVTDKVDVGPLRDEIDRLIVSAYRDTIAARLDRSFEWIETPQVLRYEAGGHYGKHADSDHFLPAEKQWVRSLDRDVSLLLYLNQDFSGGELEFSNFNYRYRPQRGDLMFFPSDHRYVHQALPVRWGVRYAVVSWAAFLGGPRVGNEPPPGSIESV